MKQSILLIASMCVTAHATEYHVSKHGNDSADGTARTPLKTISAAANLAQPGDVITVHEGVYRERVDPPRGGSSDDKRIVYRAAPGEAVVIKGSEKITGWSNVQNDTWQVTLPNSFFGDFNPYKMVLKGDWLNNPLKLHMGAVYLDGHWLTECLSKSEVLAPYGAIPGWLDDKRGGYLMNAVWFQPGSPEANLPKKRAADFTDSTILRKANSEKEGLIIGYIRTGSYAKYENVDFGKNTTNFTIRLSSAKSHGLVEIRKDSSAGELLGTMPFKPTGHWESWQDFSTAIKPVSGKQNIVLTFKQPGVADQSGDGLWYAEVDDSNTTVWAQFKNIDPNKADVEINVRQTVFYPSKPGVNYITVRSFKMMQAATPWAPPTAEQVGLLGTHWSTGWIIEGNDISYSLCTGITLGKYGDEFDNTSKNSAEGYVATIRRALSNGWNKETVGSHIVRSNHIHNCEQAGIVGSMGAAYSRIIGNTIHDIHVRSYFNGAETAGIKFHGAVDTLIEGNHIYRANRGMWLDWMTQGTRITGNLSHDNGCEDIWVEVNHGPFLIDNNILLSQVSLFDWSQGGAFVHNLAAGEIRFQKEPMNRQTPVLKPHDTPIESLQKIKGGDFRFYNNIFINDGLARYDQARLPIYAAGNVYLHSAAVSKQEREALVFPVFDPKLSCETTKTGTMLEITLPEALIEYHPQPVTGKLLGKPRFVNQEYTDFDSSELKVNTDFFGKLRKDSTLIAGPFATLKEGRNTLKLR